MSNIFYVCAAILGIIWATCFFILHAWAFIHVFLVIAVLAIVLGIIDARRQMTQ